MLELLIQGKLKEIYKNAEASMISIPLKKFSINEKYQIKYKDALVPPLSHNIYRFE